MKRALMALQNYGLNYVPINIWIQNQYSWKGQYFSFSLSEISCSLCCRHRTNWNNHILLSSVFWEAFGCRSNFQIARKKARFCGNFWSSKNCWGICGKPEIDCVFYGSNTLKICHWSICQMQIQSFRLLWFWRKYIPCLINFRLLHS